MVLLLLVIVEHPLIVNNNNNLYGLIITLRMWMSYHPHHQVPLVVNQASNFLGNVAAATIHPFGKAGSKNWGLVRRWYASYSPFTLLSFFINLYDTTTSYHFAILARSSLSLTHAFLCCTCFVAAVFPNAISIIVGMTSAFPCWEELLWIPPINIIHTLKATCTSSKFMYYGLGNHSNGNMKE